MKTKSAVKCRNGCGKAFEGKRALQARGGHEAWCGKPGRGRKKTVPVRKGEAAGKFGGGTAVQVMSEDGRQAALAILREGMSDAQGKMREIIMARDPRLLARYDRIKLALIALGGWTDNGAH